MAETAPWTREMVLALPDDGNRLRAVAASAGGAPRVTAEAKPHRSPLKSCLTGRELTVPNTESLPNYDIS